MQILIEPIRTLIREQELHVHIRPNEQLTLAARDGGDLMRFALLLGATVAQGNILLTQDAVDARNEAMDQDDDEERTVELLEALEDVVSICDERGVHIVQWPDLTPVEDSGRLCVEDMREVQLILDADEAARGARGPLWTQGISGGSFYKQLAQALNASVAMEFPEIKGEAIVTGAVESQELLLKVPLPGELGGEGPEANIVLSEPVESVFVAGLGEQGKAKLRAVVLRSQLRGLYRRMGGVLEGIAQG